MWLTRLKNISYRVTKHPRQSDKKHLWQCPVLFAVKSSFTGSIIQRTNRVTYNKLSSGTSLSPQRRRAEICWTYSNSSMLAQIETLSYFPKLNTFFQLRFSDTTWSIPCQYSAHFAHFCITCPFQCLPCWHRISLLCKRKPFPWVDPWVLITHLTNFSRETSRIAARSQVLPTIN